jgi:MFS transporter, BCD family, chlorophyll transporter
VTLRVAIRLCGIGALAGASGFAALVFSAPLTSVLLLFVGAAALGIGSGLFAVGTLLAVMALPTRGEHGLALGAWGAVQATSAGLAMACAGLVRDRVAAAAAAGTLPIAEPVQGIGYVVVYHIAILGLFVLLAVLGPLAARRRSEATRVPFGIAEFPV